MNPVQFKVSSVEDNNMTKVKGMTVFNTEQVNTKKQPMFFGKPLGVQRYDSYKYPVFDKLTTQQLGYFWSCLLYTSPSPRDAHESRMPSSA